jgi:hypothetical protein
VAWASLHSARATLPPEPIAKPFSAKTDEAAVGIASSEALSKSHMRSLAAAQLSSNLSAKQHHLLDEHLSRFWEAVH